MNDRLAALGAQETLAAQAASAIREAILAGDFNAGEKLSVPDLARRLGISRSPTREALLLLERQGLVESRPRFGVVVVTGDLGDIRQLFQIREALDGMAARLAAKTLTEDEHGMLRSLVERHREIVQRQDVEAHIATDTEFHGFLRRRADNLYLTEALRGIEHKLAVLMRAFSTRPRALGPGVIRDHGAIVDALVLRDGDAAEDAARRHVRNVARFVESSLNREKV